MISPGESREEFAQRIRRATRGKLAADPTAKLAITGYWDVLRWCETARGAAYWAVQWTAILDRSSGASYGTLADGRSAGATLGVNGWRTDERMQWIERLGRREGLTTRAAREVARVGAAAEGHLEAYVLGTVKDLQP